MRVATRDLGVTRLARPVRANGSSRPRRTGKQESSRPCPTRLSSSRCRRLARWSCVTLNARSLMRLYRSATPTSSYQILHHPKANSRGQAACLAPTASAISPRPRAASKLDKLADTTMVVAAHAANSGSEKPFDLVMFALPRSCIVWSRGNDKMPPTVANAAASNQGCLLNIAGLVSTHLRKHITRKQDE